MSPETKAKLSNTQNFGITLGSGIVAGFAAAVLSHVGLSDIQTVPVLILARRYPAVPDQQGPRPERIHGQPASYAR